MITLRDVVLRRGAKVLLDGASATINPGEKVGLVGRNGAGKSTLFALLTGLLHEDGGEFSIPRQWRMAQVAQNMPETSESATAFVLAGDTRLVEINARLAAAEAADDGMEIAQAHADLADAGAHDAVPRAQALILGLGFQVAELERPVDSFSGGWRMRLQLARALMCPSDLLLLDEPTNHLDLDALVWLEAWLQKYPGTIVVISHDREFLDAVTGVTLHIEQAKLTRYGGNYSRFEEMRALQMEQQQAAYARQQDKIAHLQKFIDRFKAQATKARQAQSRVKAIERMEKVAPLLAEAEFSFSFKDPGHIPNPMLSVTDASFGYPPEHEGGAPTVILRGVGRSVLAGQRIGILGANGHGKSTFVKTIAHDLQLVSGTITEGKGLAIGYFAQQELDVLHEGDNPLEHMVRLARELGADARESTREQDLRSFLGSFNFSGDMVKQPVGTMSGGEKARLVLAMMVWQRPNLLVLDEPTNHLDLATREALAMALNGFEGALMLVSHDRALLRTVCDEFWMVGRGKVQPFDGDLDDYQRYLLEESKRLREAARSAAAAAVPQPPQAPAAPAATDSRGQRKLDAQVRQQLAARTRPLQREVETIDRRLAVLGTERAEIERRLAQPLPPDEIADAGRRLKAVGDEVERLEERWLELSGEIEALTQAA
ncbi:ABC-F family ATP-binding cassette domain-containing protein [Xylophilus sp.]|uniref:ABC-F family ATP-binding cassette domain-containing protein n=1 Tax=Xylophilus sp. TaxID=2653893 RepID=UPI0013B84479|nr:ATP-binding cassette domain-containing protein [Xylophilus sp.]KAF1047260.1 MAG: putative ABC transporter ATP-binding protein YheS [Xylophilus sp.]